MSRCERQQPLRQVNKQTAGRPLYIVLLLAMVACTGTLPPPNGGSGNGKTKSVFVAIHGWHSGIVVKAADMDANQWPEIADFAQAEHVEIGWGDWDYYQHPNPGLGTALKAAFWSSRSVLHVAGFKGSPAQVFHASDIIEISLSERDFKRLIEYISQTFLRPETDPSLPSRPGLYLDGRFYSARGSFHLFRTCNTWVAEALRAAGLPITPVYAISAGNLGYQVKRIGVVRQER